MSRAVLYLSHTSPAPLEGETHISLHSLVSLRAPWRAAAAICVLSV